MPRLKTYDLFICHAWRYDGDYYRLVNLLEAAPLFKWQNHSVPWQDPLDASTTCVSVARLIAKFNQRAPSS